MKFFIFSKLAIGLLFFSLGWIHPLFAHTINNSDSIIINHVLDGNTSEWSANKFEQDKSTNIKYSVDNDTKNLYVAMIIPDFSTQINMMSRGMQLYIDNKGKKKEGKGIRFPQKKVAAKYNIGDKPGKADIDLMRTLMEINLLSFQLFGLTNDEQKDQGLMVPGSVNIMYTWDDKNVMSIEYNIPLSFLGDIISLNQKTLGLGWKINEAEVPQIERKVVRTETRTVAVPTGSSPPSQSRTSNFDNTSTRNQTYQNTDAKMKEQSFWTKYTISIPSK